MAGQKPFAKPQEMAECRTMFTGAKRFGAGDIDSSGNWSTYRCTVHEHTSIVAFCAAFIGKYHKITDLWHNKRKMGFVKPNCRENFAWWWATGSYGLLVTIQCGDRLVLDLSVG